MTLFRAVVGGGDLRPVFRRDHFVMRVPTMHDYPAWSALREKSRNFLQPWEPLWPHDDLTRAGFRRRIRRYHRDMREEQGYAFFIFRTEDDQLVGGITLSNVRHGVTQSCTLGYWMGEPFAGQGYMRQAVNVIVDYVFGTLKLHRIEAASMPQNQRSVSLLEKAGFTREGFARRYLLINGDWRDHVLYALIAEDWHGSS